MFIFLNFARTYSVLPQNSKFYILYRAYIGFLLSEKIANFKETKSLFTRKLHLQFDYCGSSYLVVITFFCPCKIALISEIKRPFQLSVQSAICRFFYKWTIPVFCSKLDECNIMEQTEQLFSIILIKLVQYYYCID